MSETKLPPLDVTQEEWNASHEEYEERMDHLPRCTLKEYKKVASTDVCEKFRVENKVRSRQLTAALEREEKLKEELERIHNLTDFQECYGYKQRAEAAETRLAQAHHHIAEIRVALDVPVGMNAVDYGRQLKAKLAAALEREEKLKEMNRELAEVNTELQKLVDEACTAGENTEAKLATLQKAANRIFNAVQTFRNLKMLGRMTKLRETFAYAELCFAWEAIQDDEALRGLLEGK